MYARKGDLLQFVLRTNLNKREIPYTYVICPTDITRSGDGIEVTTNHSRYERDFHRFNVIHSVDDRLKIVYRTVNIYKDRPESSLFVFGEEPDEETT